MEKCRTNCNLSHFKIEFSYNYSFIQYGEWNCLQYSNFTVLDIIYFECILRILHNLCSINQKQKAGTYFFLLHSKMILVALVSRYFLANKNTNEASYFGRRFKPYVPQGYMSGGAGYVLSKMALKKFVEKGVDDPKFCRVDAGGAEDLEFGKCMQRVGVTAGKVKVDES